MSAFLEEMSTFQNDHVLVSIPPFFFSEFLW